MNTNATGRPRRQTEVFEVLRRLADRAGITDEYELLEVIREGLQQRAVRS